MKHLLKVLMSSVCLLFIANIAFAQDTREAKIRKMENLERESVLKGDSAALFNKIWSPEMIVNAPANIVVTVDKTKAKFRAGGMNYLSFERNIEKITFNDNVAVSMGGEVIKPQGNQENPGKTVTRRFTHVWLYKNNQWSIIARQATIIKIE